MELILSFAGGLVLATIIFGIIIRHNQLAAKAEQERALSEAAKQATLQVAAATSRIQAEYDSYRTYAEQVTADRDRRDAEARAERERLEKEARAEREAQQQKQLEMMQAQFEATSQKLLKEREEELGKANRTSVGQLIDPIKEQMEKMRVLMGETRSANEKSTASLEGALQEMIKQTLHVGHQADNLAEALKNKGKVHGDWGEQVLEDILLGSGLRIGEEYSRQESYIGAKGNELRPDVVIKCADGKRIIVDSKVSLTAYAEALEAPTEIERDEAIKRNYDSVRKHVKELADKDYPKYVEGALNYVLMFIPNEGAYVMAMNYDHSLAQEAFRQGIVIVNPTNLMLALNLILQTWHQTRQEDNCRKILEVATGLHDKVMVMVDTSRTLQRQLETVNSTFGELRKQVETGTGNVLKRVEDLRELGVASTKRTKKRKALKSDDDLSTALPEESED